MIKQTLIHAFALICGVGIIICLTLVAKSLRNKLPIKTIECFDCTSNNCASLNVETTKCDGKCLTAQVDDHGKNVTIQLCYPKARHEADCLVNLSQTLGDELAVRECQTCDSDLCNAVVNITISNEVSE